MPEWCPTMRCYDCDSHAIVNGKLNCNYMNRLGLSQPQVKSFLDMTQTPEQLEEQIKQGEEANKKMKEDLEKLQKLRETTGAQQ